MLDDTIMEWNVWFWHCVESHPECMGEYTDEGVARLMGDGNDGMYEAVSFDRATIWTWEIVGGEMLNLECNAHA